ncbi:hypothetical protein [Neobacillus drentensis]|uniref:hypothetical protein n=1 Tax=Neobacillus drentensis TaxID=220684 RepID=UPI002855B40D|nr:hypothetical protein [Neobacillus drentensis]MDR7239095.1 cytochrome oxidase Cu insertion factor (SCO1/SenC/PrrC family) [Neobacillus drentensis]
MKQLSVLTFCIIGIFLLMTGCSEKQSSDMPLVNSGTLDEKYVGDKDVKLKENYKQTTKEEQLQANILEEIEKNKSSASSSSGGGHF